MQKFVTILGLAIILLFDLSVAMQLCQHGISTIHFVDNGHGNARAILVPARFTIVDAFICLVLVSLHGIVIYSLVRLYRKKTQH